MNPQLEKIGFFAIIIFGGLIVIGLLVALVWAMITSEYSGGERLKMIESKCLSMNQTMIPSIIVPQQARCYDNNSEVHEYIIGDNYGDKH